MLKQSSKLIQSVSSKNLKVFTSKPLVQSRFYASATPSEHVISIKDDDHFIKHLKETTKPFIVDVYADWCGPCKMLGPILQSVVTEMNGKVELVTINSDNLPDLAGELGVEALPTLFFVQPGGKFVYRHVGFADRANVQSLIKKHLLEQGGQ